MQAKDVTMTSCMTSYTTNNRGSIWRRSLTPTGKIATLAVTAQKCSMGRILTQYFRLNVLPQNATPEAEISQLNPANNSTAVITSVDELLCHRQNINFCMLIYFLL